jgi:Calx-beta domain/FG-GAP-like repeat
MWFRSWLDVLGIGTQPRRSRSGQRSGDRRRPMARRLLVEGLEQRQLLAFLPAADFPFGPNPVAVVAADFNNDGHLDLATTSLNWGGNDVSVGLGNGDGTFQAPQYYSVGSFGSIEVGDFNGDSKPDLVIGTSWAQGVSDFVRGSVAVLLGNGDGSFQYASTFPTGGELTVSVAVADFNADGKLDLAVTGNSDASIFADVVVMLGRGDGTFAARSHHDVPYLTQSVVTGDFNLDGKVDLAWMAWDAIGAHFGNGDGTFAPAQYFATDAFPVSVDVVVAMGDFNGDARPDMAAADYWYNTVSLPPSLRINDVTVTEGNTGAALAGFIVTLSVASTEVITIAYATGDGTGAAGSDFSSTSGIVTFAPGETSQTITVAVIGDRLGEPNETFVVNLSSPTNATIADGQGVGTILDDEPRISVNNVTVTEGNTGSVNAVFTVTLSHASDEAVTVAFATANGTAGAGSDYTEASGNVTVPAGQLSQTFAIAVKGDRLAEPNETFFVNLSTPTGATIADGQGLGSIVDDEPRISISDVSKSEGRKGKTTLFTFTVTLSGAYDQAVTMSFRTVNGTATTGNDDYVAKTGTLTFAPGETMKTITITVKGDSKRESNETFYLDLFGNSGNSLLAKNRGIGTILNDD